MSKESSLVIFEYFIAQKQTNTKRAHLLGLFNKQTDSAMDSITETFWKVSSSSSIRFKGLSDGKSISKGENIEANFDEINQVLN